MLDAAQDLILEVGSRRTTLKEVGERAGYSRGLANARFGSKDTLFIKLTDRCRRRWVSELKAAAEGKSGLDVLLSRLDAISSFADKHPHEARVMYILWFESVGAPSAINSSLARFHDAARSDIAHLVLASGMITGEGAKSRAEGYAVRFCGAIFGLCYQWLVNEKAIDINLHLNDIRHSIANGSAELSVFKRLRHSDTFGSGEIGSSGLV